MNDRPKLSDPSEARPAQRAETAGAPTAPAPTPIPVAIIANAPAPYRSHVHLRIAREMPELELYSLYTHVSEAPGWTLSIPPETRPVLFGKDESVDQQDKLRGLFHEWRKGGKILRWLETHGVRFVLVLGYNDAARGRIIRWCYANGIPCALWGDSNIRGDHARGIKLFVKRLFMAHILRRCACVLPCGRLGMEYFRKYGAREEQMFLFPLEPDYELIAALPPEEIDATRRRFGLMQGRRRLIFSGRLVQLKRVDLLIQAFVAIADARPDWDLVIAGDGPLRKPLERLVPPPLLPRVIWTGFLDNQTTVSALYRCSDVLVLTSNYDAWALVINEAAAANLAIVASDVVGAAAELVRDGRDGRIFASENLAALTEALIDVTDDAKTGRFKSASAGLLAEWRRRGDPVEGLRRALRYCGVM